MRSAGLTKLGLIIWHMAHSTAAECSGFTVGSNGGRFPRRFLQNIALFLEQAKADGYDEVQIRFAPMGANSPTYGRAGMKTSSTKTGQLFEPQLRN